MSDDSTRHSRDLPYPWFLAKHSPPTLTQVWLKVFFATYTVVAVVGGALVLVLVPVVCLGKRLFKSEEES